METERATQRTVHGLSIKMSPLKEKQNQSGLHAHVHSRLHSVPRLRHFSSDSEDDDDTSGADLLTKMEKRARERSAMMKQPMSSPVRKHEKESPVQSKTLGDKYTLRSRNYVPFNSRQRERRRSTEQLNRRGGSEEMARFVLTQYEKEERERLMREADAVARDFEELSDVSDGMEDPYHKELEDMLRKEEEELDAMIADLSLNQ